MSILVTGTSISTANAADPDGVYEYCSEKMNKNNSTDCACITEKYYPKKEEMEQLYGVPITEKGPVLAHLTTDCIIVDKTVDREYQVCMTSGAFKRNRNEFGGERFCRCYADEWGKQLSDFQTTPNAVVDVKTGGHLKVMARTNCQKKLR